MRTLFIIDNNPIYTLSERMWSKRTIEQELEAVEIETAPRVMLLKYLTKNSKIIDSGCGFGKWLIYLNQLGYKIIGIDNNEMVISKLKKYNNSLQVELGNILTINYPDNYFDAYISMGVVEHFENGPLMALKEAYRVLKPNGLIFLSTPTVNIIRKVIIQPILNIFNRCYYLFVKIKRFIEKPESMYKVNNYKKVRKAKKKKYYHFLEYRFTVKELHSFLKKSNFRVIETVPHDFHGSREHSIGLGVDFPFLKKRNSVNFKLNYFGKIISRILDGISPWIACASVLCVGKSLKKS